MKQLPISVLILSVLSVSAYSAPKNLADCKALYEKEAAKIESAHHAELNRAFSSYGKNLDATESSYKKAGDLNGSLAVRKEKARFQKEKNVPDEVPSYLPPLIQKAQHFYHRATMKARAEKAKAMAMLTNRYLRRLDAMKKELVSQDKLDEAIAVDAEMKRVEFIVADIESRAPKVVPQPRPSSAPPTRSSLAPKAGQKMALDLGDGVKMEFVWIPAGKFEMGSPDNEFGRSKEEGPAHGVRISRGFWMGATEVTRAQYKRVMEGEPADLKTAQFPVGNVNWDDARGFCINLQERYRLKLPPGLLARLPTEAEWEYGCRAGTDTPFNTGMGIPKRSLTDTCKGLEDAAWYYHNSGWKPHPVAQKEPNAWGLYDMHGNVTEWCEDRMREYGKHTVVDPKGIDPAKPHVNRGGAFGAQAPYCRSACRTYYLGKEERNSRFGFRIVVAPR